MQQWGLLSSPSFLSTAKKIHHRRGRGGRGGGEGRGDQPAPQLPRSELAAIFRVVADLLGDPSWPQLHPRPCTGTPWPGLQCEPSPDDARVLRATRLHFGHDVATPPCGPGARLGDASLRGLPHLKTLSLFGCFVAAAVGLPPALFEGASASALEQVVLKSNPGLRGPIPATLGGLRSLRVLSLSQNGFGGITPSSSPKMTNGQHQQASRTSRSTSCRSSTTPSASTSTTTTRCSNTCGAGRARPPASCSGTTQALVSAPVEKLFHTVVIKEIKGSQYGVQLESSVRDRLVAADKYDETGEEALGKVAGFFWSKYFEPGSVVTFHFPATPEAAEYEVGFGANNEVELR